MNLLDNDFLNNLEIKIDWLSFCVPSDVYTVERIITDLGYDPSDFTKMEKGANGYKDMYKLSGYPMFIMANGSKEMGIFISCSGSVIFQLVRTFFDTLKTETPFWSMAFDLSSLSSNATIELLKFIKNIGKISRLDLAIDDIGKRYFSCEEIMDLIRSGQCVSKFRNVKSLQEHSISTFENLGYTVYLGSRQSEIMLRIYDKKKQLKSVSDLEIDHEWVRWELELKDSRANAVVDRIIKNESVGIIALSVLSHYVRFIVLDDLSNKSRCSVLSKWQKFCENIEPCKLYCKPEPKTLEQKKEWFKSQVMPTLAGIVYADYGSLEIVTNNLDTGYDRMSKQMREVVSNARN